MAKRIIIPARYASVRFPGKVLEKIEGQTILAHVYQKAKACDFDSVLIATDDECYSNQILKSFSKQNFFKLLLKTSDNQTLEDYKIYPTKYFRKAKKENRRINLFIYKK